MKTQMAKVAGRAAALAGTVQALAMGTAAHAQEDVDRFFGGSGGASDFADTAGLGDSDLTTTIASIINTALGFLGVVAVVIILYGGFLWMTSGGNDDKVKQAKKLMISGVIGLVIIFSSFAIAQFVIGSLSSATG